MITSAPLRHVWSTLVAVAFFAAAAQLSISADAQQTAPVAAVDKPAQLAPQTTAQPKKAPKRVALVIGNNIYDEAPPLANAVNDARLVESTLRKLGFSVTVLLNGSLADTRQVLLRFAQSARESDVALAYFAGHGMEVDGEQYLAPVDSRLRRGSDAETQTIRASLIRGILNDAKRAGLLLLDICRDNPFGVNALSSRAPAASQRGRGFARLGTVIRQELVTLFATGAGGLTADGIGANGPFATAIARGLGSDGDILRVMGKVADDVRLATKGAQRPELRVENVFGTPLCLVKCTLPALLESRAPSAVGKEECNGSWTVSTGAPARFGFVVANTDYAGPSLRPLVNTAGDARLMSAALSDARFAVKVCYNLRRESLLRELSAYYKAVDDAVQKWEAGVRDPAEQPVAFFYFSGHGASSVKENLNYLIPLGQDVERASQLPTFGVRVRDVAESLVATGAIVFVVADACRTALAESETKSGDSKGLVLEQRRDGAIIAFSAAPGQVALDKNTYARALSDGIRRRPGDDVRLIFVDVREKVSKETQGKQKPYAEDGLTGRFRFHPS